MSATRNVVDVANLIEIPVVLISTDWVFDDTARATAAALDEELPSLEVAMTRLGVELEQARG